jgi:uncharacterized protein DUF5684
MFTASFFEGWSPGVNIGFIFTGLLLGLTILVVGIVGLWKVFEKAGQPGWASIIPLYNSWVLAEVAGKPGWWGLYPLLGSIPFLGWVATITVSLYLAFLIAGNFGKSKAFGFLGLWLFSFVGYLILGFGDAQYHAPGTTPPAPTDPNMPPTNPLPPTLPTGPVQ